MITLATLVIAGEADSTGNASSGAFGNGSGSGAGAVAAAVAGPAERRVAVLSPDGFGGGEMGGAGGGGAVLAFASAFGFLGLSHFSQRIPLLIAAPHMKHLEAIERAILRPLLVLLQRDSLRRRLEGFP
jgi:hypothetical protein